MIGDLTGNGKGNWEGNVNGNVTGTASYATSAGTAINFGGELLGDIVGPQIATSIKNGAVTTEKIANESITSAKLAPNTIIPSHIADGSITTPKLADNAVTSVKILDGSITTSKLADVSITNAKIINNANIPDSKLAIISTVGKVANSATTATHVNTNNTIVLRNHSQPTQLPALNIDGDVSISGYRNLSMLGGNSSGFLYGSFSALGDGIYLGYNYYARGDGIAVIPNAGGTTSRLSTGYGYISFNTGAYNSAPIERMKVDNNAVSVSHNLTVTGSATFNGITASTFTGNLNGTGQSSVGWLKTTTGTSAGGVSHYFMCNSAGSQRWGIGMYQNESTNNAGSNFALWRYGNNGDFLGSAIDINRSTSDIVLSGPTRIVGSLTTTQHATFNAGISLNNGQNITNVGTIFPSTVHFPSTNGTITGDGKITFTNDGGVDFYHRRLSTVKSLTIDGSAWGSDPESSTGALTIRSNNYTGNTGISLGRVINELEVAVVASNSQLMQGTTPGDSVVRATGNLFLGVSNLNPSIVMSTNTVSIHAGNNSSVLTVTPALTTITNELRVTRGNYQGAISLLSGNTAQYTSYSLGRTARELEIGISAGIGHFISGSVAGDATIVNTNSNNSMLFGVGNTIGLRISSTGVTTTGSETLRQLSIGSNVYTLYQGTTTKAMSNGVYRGTGSITQPVFTLTATGVANRRTCGISGSISMTNATGSNWTKTIMMDFVLSYVDGVAGITTTVAQSGTPNVGSVPTASLSFVNDQLLLTFNSNASTTGWLQLTWDAYFKVIVNSTTWVYYGQNAASVFTLTTPTVYL